MAIQTLDVIWIKDDRIKPPGPKMVVCVEPFLGLFLRINSAGWRNGSVSIPRNNDHAFLKHDSYIECGDPFELDDFIINEALSPDGPIGRVSPRLANEISDAVRRCALISRNDKNAICTALERAR